MYVVVIWGDYTQAVPKSWIDENFKTLKWPPKDIKPGLAIKKQFKPAPNWHTITYSKIVYTCEDYVEAKAMEVEATFLSSDASLHVDQEKETTKRKIKKPNMDDYETTHRFLLPADTYVPNAKQLSELQDSSPLSPNMGQGLNTDAEEYEVDGDETQISDKANESQSQDFFNEPLRPHTPIRSHETVLKTPRNVDPIPCPCHTGIKKVLQELVKLRQDIENITQRNTSTITRDFSLLPQLPLRNAQQLHKFENDLLHNNDMQLQFKSKVMSVGGRDLPHNLRNILKTFISNTTAAQFTWTGAKSPNMAIRGTKFIETIFEVLQVEHPRTTLNEMETVTREWFRHASDRLKKQ